MPKYINYQQLSLPIFAWLIKEDYIKDPDPFTVSVSEIIKPIKPLVLSRHVNKDDTEIDVMNLLSSKIGTAIHNELEQVMQDLPLLIKAGELLNIPEKVIRNALIMTETRTKKEIIPGYTLSGEFDLMMENQVSDYKSMSSYAYFKHSPTKFIRQMSAYKYLNPDIITSDLGSIHYIITDFSAYDASREGFPQSKMFTEMYNLYSNEETEAFLIQQFNALKQYENNTVEELNELLEDCDEVQLEIEPSVFKYYADPAKTARSTKNFTDSYSANEFMASKGGKGIVIEVKGKISGCKFCSALSVCKQGQTYLEADLL